MPFESDTVAILALPLADFDALRNQLSNRRVRALLVFTLVLSIIQLILTLFSSFLVQSLAGIHWSLQVSSSAFVSALHLIISWLHLITAFYLHRSYYWKLRLIGFHAHYEKTVRLLQLVEKLNNHCSVFLLAIWTLFSTLLSSNADISSLNFLLSMSDLESRKGYISIAIVTVFLSAIGWFLVRLLTIEFKFKATRNLPDVYEIENPEIPGRNLLETDIGIRQTSYVEDLLFKQSELIENLKLQNWHLRDSLSKLNRTNDSIGSDY